MKCPWRPVQINELFNSKPGTVVRTDFAECYKGECPFYLPECKVAEHLIAPEHCKRTKHKEE